MSAAVVNKFKITAFYSHQSNVTCCVSDDRHQVNTFLSVGDIDFKQKAVFGRNRITVADNTSFLHSALYI